LEILAIVAIFLGGLALIAFEHCTATIGAALSAPRAVGSSKEALAGADFRSKP
jgi:hypothetical protein